MPGREKPCEVPIPAYHSSLAPQTRLQDPTPAPDVQLLLLVQSKPPLCLATSTRFTLHRCSHLAEDNLPPAPSCWRHRDLCLMNRLG